MFTGIVQEVGSIERVRHGDGGSVLTLRCPAVRPGLQLGASVAIDGVCLTVTHLGQEDADFDAMHETLRRSTLAGLATGSAVNVEGALRAGDPLGGHVLQGHVDGVGEIVEERSEGFSRVLRFSVPADLLRYLVEKGSVGVSGVSLTVSALTDDCFEVSLIPHTLQHTTLGSLGVGDRVNIEVDVLAKYVERLVGAYVR